MFQQLYRNRHDRFCGLLCQNQVSSSTTREQNFQQKASTRFSCTNYVTTNAPFQPTNFIFLSLDPLLMSHWNYKCASKRTTQGKLLRSNSYIKVACAFHHGHLSKMPKPRFLLLLTHEHTNSIVLLILRPSCQMNHGVS
jgi:hypothetical protein